MLVITCCSIDNERIDNYLHCMMQMCTSDVLSVSLTHLCLVDFSSITLWTGLFPIAGFLVSFYYDCFKETLKKN